MFTYQDALESTGPLPSSLQPYAWGASSVGAGAAAAGDSSLTECEEMLILDRRANLGPAQQVENKLSTLLGGALLPVSHVRMPALLCGRNHC